MTEWHKRASEKSKFILGDLSFPSSSQGLDQLDSGLLASGAGLAQGPLFLKTFTLRVDDFKERDETGVISEFGKAGCFVSGVG